MVAFILTISVSIVLSLYGLAKRNYITINVLTLFVVFQNFVLVLISSNIDKSMYNMVILIKEIYVVLAILLYVGLNRKGNKSDFTTLMIIALLVVLTFVHGAGTIMSRLSSLRQLYLPMIFYLFGRKIKKNQKTYSKAVEFFVMIMFLAVIFSFVEIINPDKVWSSLGISDYLYLKGTDRYVFVGKTLPGNFYSYDLYPLLPVLRRTGSFLLDPVIYGQLLGAAFILILFDDSIFSQKKTKRYIMIAVLGFGLVLTLAKGGILIAAISFMALLKVVWKKNLSSKLIAVLLCGIAAAYIMFIIKNGVGALAHWKGLIDGFKIIVSQPLGLGIGGFGNLSAYYSTEIQGTGESFIGAVIGQLGIIGVIIYTWFYKYLFNTLSITKDRKNMILLWLNISLFITTFLNNTAISFTNCFIFYVLAGVVASTYRKTKRSTYKEITE